MRAEEEYRADYATVALLHALVRLIEIKSEEAFACGVEELWVRVLKLIPEQYRQTPPCLVLDTYFKTHGDLRKGLRQHEESLLRVVGYEAHRDAMLRLKNQLSEIDNMLNIATRADSGGN